MKKRICTLALASLFAFSAMPVSAQFSKARDAVDYRQAAMDMIKVHFGRLAPVAKGARPLDDAAKADVTVLRFLSDLPWPAFGEGMQGGDSKRAVFSDAAGFKQAAADYQAAVAQLASASDAGDIDAFRAAFAKTGQSCKSCHDAYRD